MQTAVCCGGRSSSHSKKLLTFIGFASELGNIENGENLFFTCFYEIYSYPVTDVLTIDTWALSLENLSSDQVRLKPACSASETS